MTNSAPNEINLALDVYLLFSVFYEAWGNPPGHRKLADSYLSLYDEQIRVTGHLLDALGLARRDGKNQLGWRLAERLVSLVVKPRRCRRTPKRRLTSEEVKALNVILEWSTREFETRSEVPEFIYPVLHVLGLAKLCDDGRTWIPTNRLCKLTDELQDEDDSSEGQEMSIRPHHRLD
jgi:hypothetical protein